jgi:hypothetical protein
MSTPSQERTGSPDRIMNRIRPDCKRCYGFTYLLSSGVPKRAVALFVTVAVSCVLFASCLHVLICSSFTSSICTFPLCSNFCIACTQRPLFGVGCCLLFWSDIWLLGYTHGFHAFEEISSMKPYTCIDTALMTWFVWLLESSLLLSSCIEWTPSLEANSCTASQEILCLLRSLKIHFRDYRIPAHPLGHLNAILPSTPRSPKWSLTISFATAGTSVVLFQRYKQKLWVHSLVCPDSCWCGMNATFMIPTLPVITDEAPNLKIW